MSIGNVKVLKTSTTRSAKELREFVESLKGRSPADAMGVVARSHLLQAMVISLVIQIIFVLGFTLFASPPQAPKKAAQNPVAAEPVSTAPATSTASASAPATTTAVPASTSAPATSTGPAPEVIKKVMGTETVTPDKKKPDIDDLMKGMR